MNDRMHANAVDKPRKDGSSAEPARSEHDEWMHEFRNALGNILVAAGAAKGLLGDQHSPEIAMAMGHIEDGCDRCLRLLRTMPP